MSTLRRPETVALKDKKTGPPPRRGRPRTLAIAFLLALVPSIEAQVANAQRAIEALEGCSKQERKSGCINILKRKPAGENRQAIKAQVRGGRIIWYEYDKKTGSVRRTN